MSLDPHDRSSRPWIHALRGGVAVSLGFVLLRFVLTPIRMQVLTRILTPADYGMVTLLSMSASGMAMILSAGGFELLLRQLPGADPEERPRIFRSVLAVSTVLGLAACGLVLLGIIPVSGSGDGVVSRGAVAALCLLFLHVHQRLYYLLGCRRNLQARATQLLWSDAWFLAAIPCALVASCTAERAVWVWCAWLLLLIVATWRWVPLGRIWKAGAGGVPLNRMLAFGLPMLPAVLAEWMFRLVGQYVLLARTDAETMALYALAFNIAGIGYVVGVPVIDVLTAEFNAAHSATGNPPDTPRRESLRRIVSRAVRFILAVTIPAALAFVFLAKPIVILLAGPAFMRTADLLPCAALIPGFLLMNLLLARLLLADGRPASVGVGSLAGAVIALGLCLLWVSSHGARGVLVAVTGGLAVSTIIMGCRARLFRWMDPTEMRWGRLVLGTVALTALFASLGSPEALPIVRLTAAGITAAVLLVALGWWRWSDFLTIAVPGPTVRGGADHD